MLQTPLKITGNLRGFRENYQQAPVHWLWEITKAKLSRAEPSQAIFGQVWVSLGKLGQAGPS